MNTNETNVSVSVVSPKEAQSMKDLLQEKNINIVVPKVGDTLQGLVIEKGRNRIYLDLNGFRTGVLYKNEMESFNTSFQDIKKGDMLGVKITELENKDGLVEVSLMQATIDQSWDAIRNLKNSGEVIEAKITGANRGGLTAQVEGLAAFLPVSQLSSQNYPHVEGGDKEEILKILKKFVGQVILVKIIDFDQKNQKIILSEKAKISKEMEAKLSGYNLGDHL